MHHGSVTPEIVAGLLALKKRSEGADIPPSRLDSVSSLPNETPKFMTSRTYRQTGLKLFLCLMMLIALPRLSHSTPPAYPTFKREQRTAYAPDPAEILRIWIVYIGQGDGILIQLPPKYNYDPDPSDADNERVERIDVVVDGGANPTTEAGRLTDFIRQMYEITSPTVEYIVITHHDQDHVVGITRLLEESDITFDTVYHNGLASYRGGKRGFPSDHKPPDVVGEVKNRRLNRAMTVVNAANEFDPSYLIKSLGDLRNARNGDELQGIYDDLAEAVLKRADDDELTAFQRAEFSAPFIAEREAERGTAFSDIEFKILWPLTKAKSYGSKNWGETINGNSVTFRLAYQDFSMVFTGDHNDKSEPELLAHLAAEGKMELLDCDVFKVPHHGSSHGVEDFFKRPGFDPILSVASMGDVGFKSKQMTRGAWQHPSTDVIGWLGGFHRVYHTFAHERAFDWDEITSKAKREAMIERSHLLIETDGKWFRLTEVPVDSGNPSQPPTVAQTQRGNGTQWIRATTD